MVVTGFGSSGEIGPIGLHARDGHELSAVSEIKCSTSLSSVGTIQNHNIHSVASTNITCASELLFTFILTWIN